MLIFKIIVKIITMIIIKIVWNSKIKIEGPSYHHKNIKYSLFLVLNLTNNPEDSNL